MLAAVPIYLDVIGGLIALFVAIIVFAAGDQFFGEKFQKTGQHIWQAFCATFVIAVALFIIFPLNHGDGRSVSYNKGWDFATGFGAGYYFKTYGYSCPKNWAEQTHFSQPTFGGIEKPYGNNYPHTNKDEWIKGCNDATRMLRNEQQEVTIPFRSY